MFIDYVRLHITGGAGGNGCCSFRKEKYVPLGGPDGGDGGNGGDVFIVATSRLTTLMDLRYHNHWKGTRGVHGKGKNLHGRCGEAIEIAVPCGTLVRDFESGDVLCDLTDDGQRFLAVPGGKGGKGNTRFTTSTQRAPKFAEKGEPGEAKEFLLELKLIAEVGLVGLPNAGKSTLLAAISSAHPKVGDYPFTTLHPNLGMAMLPDHRTLSIADIPGIIEGAAEGKGLGLDFLRHIERTKVLVYLIDLGDPEPAETLATLQSELEQYEVSLADRPHLIVFNKADITENRERYAEELAPDFPNAFLISGATGEGAPELLEALWQTVEKVRSLEAAEAEAEPVIDREYTYESPFEIKRIPSGFRISGERVHRAVSMTDFENDEAVRHLQQVFTKMGLLKALKRMGAKQGQSIYIGDLEMEYEPD
ncbi:MAG: GTPase ObgE [Candidatus Hydrogenedentes bacterium]|nr:GTPase ObgE [Candidatus Hydrogenedentota bacterium]